jgi:hypothetical protein
MLSPESKRRRDSIMIGTVKVITVSFLEDEVWEGSIPAKCYDEARVESYEVDDIEEAIKVIEREGLSFTATGTDWAANPDGSFIANYATGERHEVTAHLEGFSEADEAAIIEGTR